MMKIVELDAIIEDLSPSEATIAVVLANVEREPLNPIEMAHSLKALTTHTDEGGGGMTPTEAVAAMGYTDPSVYRQYTMLLELPKWCQELCETVEKFWSKGKLLKGWYTKQTAVFEAFRPELETNPRMSRDTIKDRLNALASAMGRKR